MKLRNVYDNDLEQWIAFSRTYGLAKRLGFKTAQAAWQSNPMIEGSVIPSDYRKVST